MGSGRIVETDNEATEVEGASSSAGADGTTDHQATHPTVIVSIERQ